MLREFLRPDIVSITISIYWDIMLRRHKHGAITSSPQSYEGGIIILPIIMGVDLQAVWLQNPYFYN